jgi:hypothetical protein
MHFLKSFILKFSFLFFCIFLVSCSQSIDFDKIFFKNQPFNVVIIVKTDSVMLGDKTTVEIQPGSEDFIKFEEWLHQNNTGWDKTIASFEKQNMVIQNDFELYYMGYYVAISYKDSEGSSHHFNKTVQLGSLDFLFD